MARRLFTLLSALSLLLCAATAALWVRSYFAWDLGFVGGEVEGGSQRVLDGSSERGKLTFFLTRTEGFSLGTSRRVGAKLGAMELPDDPAWPSGTRLGFRLDRRVRYRTFDNTAVTPPKETVWTVGVPHWLLAALTGLAPALRFAPVWRRRRRVAAGLCLRCGYDLRATPGRCPECGTAPGSVAQPPEGAT